MRQTIEYTCNPAFFPKSHEILCWNQCTIDEYIDLPDHKPNIQKINDVIVTPEIESFNIIDSPTGKKVFIRGQLNQDILYTVDSLCQPIHAFPSASSFCTFINLSDCNINGYDRLEAYEPKILVEYMEIVQVDSRSIRKCILLFTWYPKGIISPPKPLKPYTCSPKVQSKYPCKSSRKDRYKK